MELHEIDIHIKRFEDHSILMDRPTALKVMQALRYLLTITPQTNLDLVARFNKAFLRPEPKYVGFPEADDCGLILRLIREEVRELHEAFGVRLQYLMPERTDIPKDFVAAADGFCDIEVVLLYGVWQCGLHRNGLWQQLFDEVHASNMSKLDADGKPIYREDKKILKGPNYFPPNLRDILITHGWTPPEEIA